MTDALPTELLTSPTEMSAETFDWWLQRISASKLIHDEWDRWRHQYFKYRKGAALDKIFGVVVFRRSHCALHKMIWCLIANFLIKCACPNFIWCIARYIILYREMENQYKIVTDIGEPFNAKSDYNSQLVKCACQIMHYWHVPGSLTTNYCALTKWRIGIVFWVSPLILAFVF